MIQLTRSRVKPFLLFIGFAAARSPAVVFAWFAFLFPTAGHADPDQELREAVNALAMTSYTWQTTVRQRFSGETTEPRIDPKARVDVRGKVNPNGVMQMTQEPSRELSVAVTSYFQLGDAVTLTPLGWLPRIELRSVPNPNQEVTFEGKKVRLSRFVSVALKVTAMRALGEQLLDLMEELKSVETTNGLFIGELHDGTVEKWWGDAKAKSAPEIHGTVIFKVGSSGLSECHFVLGIGFPNSRTKKTAWTMQQWSTRITDIGSTTVDVPEGAKQIFQN